MTIVTFRVGTLLCGADVSRVQEVLRNQALTPIPRAPGSTPGLLHLRGQILTGICLRSVFALEMHEAPGRMVCVIVRDGEAAASLLADRVGEVVEVAEESIQPPPTHWQGALREYVDGVTDRQGELLLLLHIPRLLEIESAAGDEAEATTNRN
jgi:purine-binding chemotaxis protein CheW